MNNLRALFLEGILAVGGYSSICLQIFHLNSEKLRHVNIVRVVKSDELNWQGMWRVWGRIEVYTGRWWGSLRERGH
jgi:hypothetical protein